MRSTFFSLGMFLFALNCSADVGNGFTCTRNLIPFDGGVDTIALNRKSDGSFEISYTFQNRKGETETQMMSNNLECMFNSKDGVVSSCRDRENILCGSDETGKVTCKNEKGEETHYPGYIQSTKVNTVYVNRSFPDGTKVEGASDSYELTITAWNLSDGARFSLDPFHASAQNRTIQISFDLSQCRPN